MRKRKETGIYKIESRVHPERCYIGSAVNIGKRWQNHIGDMERGCHPNNRLQNHYNKYGKEDFVFYILITCVKETLIKQEQDFIDFYNPYFNICKKAGSQLGNHWKISEQSKQNGKNNRFRVGNIPWNKGKTNISSKETTKKKSEAQINRFKNFEQRKIQSERHMGKTHTLETKQKNREIMLNYWKNKKERQGQNQLRELFKTDQEGLNGIAGYVGVVPQWAHIPCTCVRIAPPLQ